MSFQYREFVLLPFTRHFVSESARKSVASIIAVLFTFWVIVARERFHVLMISIPYQLTRESCNQLCISHNVLELGRVRPHATSIGPIRFRFRRVVAHVWQGRYQGYCACISFFLIISIVLSVFLYRSMPFLSISVCHYITQCVPESPRIMLIRKGTLFVFIALWLNATSSFCKCALFDWHQFTAIAHHISEWRTETEHDMCV